MNYFQYLFCLLYGHHYKGSGWIGDKMLDKKCIHCHKRVT